MSTYYFIKSKLNGNVIDIEGASTAAGALLDAYPQKTSGTDNQLWEFVSDPQGSGYYFIKSKLNGNVVDIQGGNSTTGLKDGTPLDAFPQKAGGSAGQTDNQLWQFMKDPAGSGYCFIMSKANGNVIDILGASTKAGAGLDSFPLKPSATDNQLWEVVGGSFPKTVSAVADSSLGSNSNYILYSKCNPLINGFVSIEITQDVVCKSVGPPPPGLCKGGGSTFGFSFQLNCYSPKGSKCAWQQYVVGFWQNSSGGFNVVYGIDNWPVKGPNLINNGSPTFATLPSSVLPTGYTVIIGWGNEETSSGSSWNPNVTGAFFILTDNNGNQIGRASQTLTSISGASSSDLAPIIAFELNVVGPINGESAVLSSGTGYINYVLLQPNLSVTVAEPSCTEKNVVTCETANTFYGPLPDNNPNTTFKQSFIVSSSKPMVFKAGTPRPSTRIPQSTLDKILGGPTKS
jgi:Ricin-type beta-trefoil lectin domain-like